MEVPVASWLGLAWFWSGHVCEIVRELPLVV
jgi:hypothetical protein